MIKYSLKASTASHEWPKQCCYIAVLTSQLYTFFSGDIHSLI